MNIEKMRRNLARQVPDTVRKTFSAFDDDHDQKYFAWVKWFGRMMEIKHGSRFVNVTIFRTEDFSGYNARFEMVANLR
jgi:hypothetical protein